MTKGTIVLLRPVITEKSMLEANEGRYTFEVTEDATKFDVKVAVEDAFKVDVVDVHVMNLLGKMRRVGRKLGREPGRRKAIVRIAPGQKIERFFVEGV